MDGAGTRGDTQAKLVRAGQGGAPINMPIEVREVGTPPDTGGGDKS